VSILWLEPGPWLHRQYKALPDHVRRKKPRVAAFTSANAPKILALEPDPVLTFSDLQAPIALIRAGIAVHAFNQRDVAGILAIMPHRSLFSLEKPLASVICRDASAFSDRSEDSETPRRRTPFFTGKSDASKSRLTRINVT
jgi:hypothetical protein